MQNELTGTGVTILGVNQIGSETGNELNCEGRNIPWLQDDRTTRTWVLWNVTYRDVYILGRDNELLAVYNLTEHNLADADDYAELKTMLQNAAAAP